MRLIYTALTTLFTVSIFGQTHEILKHNGDLLNVNYIKTENNLIYFSDINSTEEKRMSIYAIASLTNKSSKDVKSISNKIDINKKITNKDIVFLNELETIGLRKRDIIYAFFGKTKGFTYYDLERVKNIRLKEIAIKKGFPFILITSNLPEKTEAVLYSY